LQYGLKNLNLKSNYFQTTKFMALAYTITGTGDTVLLVHGFCESKEMWEAFVEPLSQKYRVIAIDLPGFGKSRMNFKQPSMSDLARSVAETLNLLKVQKFVFIGHSLGGYIGLEFASQNPHKLKGLGLFHSSAFADTEEKKANRTKSVEFIREHGSEQYVKNLFGDLFSEANKSSLSETIERLTEKAMEIEPEYIARALVAMRERQDYTEILSNMACPVLLIAGEDDSAVPLEMSEKQSTLPKKPTSHILPNVGHMGMFEAPTETLKMIEDFAELCFKEKGTTWDKE
jgi:pimeloyl-ACP methyl ester carboxylesterase